jgi:hypothetical protein
VGVAPVPALQVLAVEEGLPAVLQEIGGVAVPLAVGRLGRLLGEKQHSACRKEKQWWKEAHSHQQQGIKGGAGAGGGNRQRLKCFGLTRDRVWEILKKLGYRFLTVP